MPREGRLQRLLRWLNRPPAWIWPAVLVALGVGTLLGSYAFQPWEGEQLAILGRPFISECDFIELTGLPCASCGMTRSWVWAARGAFAQAFFYSPPGLLLWLWLVLGGVLGLVRLVKRDPAFLVLPLWITMGMFMGLLALMVGSWLARAFLGINPLP